MSSRYARFAAALDLPYEPRLEVVLRQEDRHEGASALARLGLPPGRRPVITSVRPESARKEVFRFVAEQVRAGRQAYIVYPLIEDSEALDVRAATEEYERHADLWPLNPEGDLLATMMIESAEGLANVDRISAIPGVGALFIGNANDLAHGLGVPQNHPDVEAARQKILAACKAHKIACNITANSADDLVRRVDEGWQMIRTTVGVINAARPRLRDPKVAPPPADPFAMPR